MPHFWRALKLLITSPKLWASSSLPAVGAVALFVALFFAGLSFVTGRFAELSELLHLPAAVGGITGGVLLTILWVLLSGPLFLVLFGVLAIPTWELLSRQVESLKNSTSEPTYLPPLKIFGDILLRILTAIVAMTIVALLGLLGLPILGALVLGFVILIDCSAPSLMKRGHTMFEQWVAVCRSPGWFSLWLLISAVSLVPVANVLLLPVFVIASTLMVLESETASALAQRTPVE